MHSLIKYKRAVDRTHKGLGNLYAFSVLATKARKCSLIVGIAGSGKSRVMDTIALLNPEGTIQRDSMTRSGLKKLEKDLNGFRGTFVIEDLGNVDTHYSLTESIKTAVALTYDHRLSKLNSQLDLEIADFYGSFISSIQPEIMPNIVNSTSWEAVMRDKTIRYYHLLRAIKPNRKQIDVKVKWGKPLEDVKPKFPRTSIMEELSRVFLDQHGLSRAAEHKEDFLKASAALDGRTKINISDVKTVLELTRPMRAEKYLIYKQGVASEKQFLVDHAYMLAEFATYGNPSLEQLASNWFVTVKSVKRILQKVQEMYWVNPKDEKRIYRKEITQDILKECGLE